MVTKSSYIGAVEIGTSKVAVLIGEVLGDRRLNIVGLGQSSSRGIIKGDAVDFKAASDCTHAAILAAEQRAGVKIDAVYLAQSGSHLAGFVHEAAVGVTSADNLVSREDMEQVMALARGKELPRDRTIIHHIRRPFRLDGRAVSDPEHLEGRQLEVGYWTVHGNAAKVADHIHIVNGFTLRVEDLILSSLASAAIVTTDEERANGVLVLDIGRGTTDWALHADGCCQLTGVVPVGGDHITNDLSLGLRLTAVQAEGIKLRYGRATIQAVGKGEKVWLNGDFAIGDKMLPRLAIDQIVSARVEEILEVVRKQAGPMLRPEHIRSGVVLTGGTARLPQIDEAAARIFNLPARVGEMPAWVKDELRDPGCATVLGLLYYGLHCRQTRASAPSRRKVWLRKLTSYLVPA
ncbi:MAG: cell division protein FtsA [Opitutaceae bacterium]